MRRTPIQVTQDILRIARHRPIKRTPLQRKSNLSTKRFNQYYEDLYYKGLIDIDDTAHVYVTDKGCIFRKVAGIKQEHERIWVCIRYMFIIPNCML